MPAVSASARSRASCFGSSMPANFDFSGKTPFLHVDKPIIREGVVMLNHIRDGVFAGRMKREGVATLNTTREGIV